MITEYYVLRIYRRPNEKDSTFFGVLEDPDNGSHWSFSNSNELTRLITKLKKQKHTKAAG